MDKKIISILNNIIESNIKLLDIFGELKNIDKNIYKNIMLQMKIIRKCIVELVLTIN